MKQLAIFFSCLTCCLSWFAIKACGFPFAFVSCHDPVRFSRSDIFVLIHRGVDTLQNLHQHGSFPLATSTRVTQFERSCSSASILICLWGSASLELDQCFAGLPWFLFLSIASDCIHIYATVDLYRFRYLLMYAIIYFWQDIRLSNVVHLLSTVFQPTFSW